MKKQWWQDKVAYQIYPKSFYDSNGDGIGDIPGIISKLDYLHDLGIDILWISPVYTSPLADQGYDIADYYSIDPRFGTMEDMEELIAEAKKRKMDILMDLVVNHCSDEHEWFQQAMADPEGTYGNFFYLSDKKDGVPCNWRSYFGGSVWEPLGTTQKQYLHMFHKKQPDLNWENPEVRKEVYRNMNWWLDKGLAGFRVDAIINIKKALPFHDYPADRDDGMCSPDVMLAEAKGVGDFLREMRDETFRKHDAFSVGEVFNGKAEELPDFMGEDGYFSSIFDFNETTFGFSDKGWYDNVRITPEDYKARCFESQEQVGTMGFLSNVIENHDEPRGVSRYLPKGGVCDASKKMLGGLNFMLRGVPFIYQGQEIGMENMSYSSIEEVDDISSREEYRLAREAGLSECQALSVVSDYSRDNARTPMQWDGSAHAGFSQGTPWLNANPNHKMIHVAGQERDENSVLSFYKKLIQLRKNPEYRDVIVYGELIPYLREQHNLMAYYRKNENQTLLVLGNYQAEPQTVVLPSAYRSVLLNNVQSVSGDSTALQLEGWQFLILSC